MPGNPLGLKKLVGIHYYVRDLERSRRFYVDALDFEEIGSSSEALERAGKQRSLVFRAGECLVTCSSPMGEGGRAYRYLRKHPDGIGTIAFEVADIQAAFAHLDKVGGTPIDEIQTHRDDQGSLSTFSITTPFGDTTFRFLEHRGYGGLFPGMRRYPAPKGGTNHFGFQSIDHITSNFQTMKPALLWLEHVLGFETLWGIQFHTKDVAKTTLVEGSGLRSSVMWEPTSGIKFANNEPFRPFFKQSQINIFNEDHRGDGVQHVALSTENILSCVRGLRLRDVRFMPTPDAYYDALPERLERLGIERVDESLEELRQLGILVDGAETERYLLQIFLRDSAGLYGSADAGPFFYELIQRKGDRGFGAGNFRALFESIERSTQADSYLQAVTTKVPLGIQDSAQQGLDGVD
jgi:4-hydroxyphenylpyruvate dioxygenase